HDDLVAVDLGVAQVDVGAAHEGDDGRLALDPPPTLADGAGHDGHRPADRLARPPRVAPRRVRHAALGDGDRQVGGDVGQLADGAGCVDAVDPLGELVEVDPALAAVGAQDVHDVFALGIGCADLRRVVAEPLQAHGGDSLTRGG